MNPALQTKLARLSQPVSQDEIDPLVYNALIRKDRTINKLINKGRIGRQDYEKLLKGLPRNGKLTPEQRDRVWSSGYAGGIGGYYMGGAVNPYTVGPRLVSGLGSFAAGSTASYLGNRYAKNRYEELSKDEKLRQIKRFIKSRKKDPDAPLKARHVSPVDPVVTGLGLAGVLGSIPVNLRNIFRGGASEYRQYTGAGANARHAGSGNMGGGGRSAHTNPYSGDMADKYEKYMSMKRMAAEGATEGERAAASQAVKKWQEKYKFACLMKLSSLIR